MGDNIDVSEFRLFETLNPYLGSVYVYSVY